MKNQDLDKKKQEQEQQLETIVNPQKTKQKEKANVKLTRLPDQSIKTTNKYGHLESMES